MGYRSEVGYKIQFDKEICWNKDTPDSRKIKTPQELFNLFVLEAKTREDTKKCFEEDEGFEVNTDKMYIKYYGGFVKWYEDFPDVKCHEKLLELADEWIELHQEDKNMDNSCIRWGFVRIGEDSDDVEERNNNDGYDLVYVTRGLSFD